METAHNILVFKTMTIVGPLKRQNRKRIVEGLRIRRVEEEGERKKGKNVKMGRRGDKDESLQ